MLARTDPPKALLNNEENHDSLGSGLFTPTVFLVFRVETGRDAFVVTTTSAERTWRGGCASVRKVEEYGEGDDDADKDGVEEIDAGGEPPACGPDRWSMTGDDDADVDVDAGDGDDDSSGGSSDELVEEAEETGGDEEEIGSEAEDEDGEEGESESGEEGGEEEGGEVVAVLGVGEEEEVGEGDTSEDT